MKSFIAAGIAALFLIVGAVGYAIYVDNTADILREEISDAEKALMDKDFEGAREYIKILDETLEQRKTMLCAIVDHKEIYEIKRSIAELSAFLDDSDDAESLAHCREIAAIVNRISENTMPYIFNIL